MKKLIITIVIAVCSFQVGFAQYDAVTQSKIKVKFFTAEELLKNREYSKALEKVEEVEALTNGPKASVIQNIKVKSYIGLGMYERAKKELNVLYKLSPSDDVLKDIAMYEASIEDGIEEEKSRIERARLAEIERKEEERLAEIKREEKRLKTEQAYKHFKYKECPKCNGYKTETAYKKVKCTKDNYNLGYCDNGIFVFKSLYQSTRKKHRSCNGTGRMNEEYDIDCSKCRGTGTTLQYVGDYDFTSVEIENILNNNRSKIIGYLNN